MSEFGVITWIKPAPACLVLAYQLVHYIYSEMYIIPVGCVMVHLWTKTKEEASVRLEMKKQMQIMVEEEGTISIIQTCKLRHLKGQPCLWVQVRAYMIQGGL